MYSAASPRLMIHSASAGGTQPKAMFCAYTAQAAWLSPQIPQMRLVHERHELVGEPWQRAADADAAHVGTAADAVHPAALGDVADDDGAPAAELHDALLRAVVGREVALLVIAAAVAALVHGL